jgi:preprotein translocase subunit YajC
MMNLFPTALADAGTEAAAPQPGFDPTFFIMLIVAVLFMYIFAIRPNSKRNKDRLESLENLAVGDEVLTNGGIIGKIVKVNDELELFTIEVAPGCQIKINRSYVVSALPKGTYNEVKVEATQKKK